MAADGLAVAGTVTAAVAGKLQTTGADYLVSQLVFGDMTLSESSRSIDLYASEVIPKLVQMRNA